MCGSLVWLHGAPAEELQHMARTPGYITYTSSHLGSQGTTLQGMNTQRQIHSSIGFLQLPPVVPASPNGRSDELQESYVLGDT